ncbi:helix-turn-helix domain-containing protein [Enterococcus sp. CWB-B31]|uniref:helix-turn-helix domain-containing protein n=1 Tax=Enterococcus sp. CWB-B31 TaxID=2885159 RepID=UPI001E2C623B|nr:helix-turn-helix transcriptional regulator [Enterococcus sp. CWB-B31]MCB5955986.1 helix-turn-helix domain-containing protein [Enterococcus sp. CWB-B31]
MSINIGETLRFFRTHLGLKQKEMLSEYTDGSVYSRIETDTRPLKLDELLDILDVGSINAHEFVTFSHLDKEQRLFRKLLSEAVQNLSHKQKKESLISYYNKLSNLGYRNIRETSNLISIKLSFSEHWEEIDAVDQEEVDKMFHYLMERKILLQYDYVLLSNLMFKFSGKQKRLIVERAFPVKYYEKRDYITLNFSCNALTNVVISCLYNKEFEDAKRYLETCDKQEKTIFNFQFHLEVKYLKNLLAYLETGNINYLQKIHSFIAVLEDSGYLEQAENIREEVKTFTHAP